MPKKIKLNLNDLKVQSFVTALSHEDMKNLKGADDSVYETNCAVCVSRHSCHSDCASCVESCVATYCGTCGTGCATCSPSYCSGGGACC